MNNKHEYIIGDTYGYQKLIDIFFDEKKRLTVAKVKCIYCGKEKVIRPYYLYSEKYNQCMCKSRTINGMSKTKIYSVYSNMKDRCYNANNHAYKNYGDKGVSLCDEWLDKTDGFMNFYNWSINNGYKEGLTIDRIDENGNYEPNNCQWITKSKNTIKANKTCQHRKANKGTYYGISPNGEYYEFDNANEFARIHKLNAGNIRQVANGQKKTHKKWIFGFVKDNETK